MASIIPNRIEFQIHADGKPIKGLLCLLTAETNYKNSFSLVVGPSNSDGLMSVTKEDILAKANEDARMFLMDYGDPLECITGSFTAIPMNLSKLNAAKNAYKSFRKSYHYPSRYIESIENAIQLLSKSSFSELSIKLISIAGPGKVRFSSVKTN